MSRADMNNETEIKQILREWIAQKSKGCDIASILDDTLILEKRIITSVQIMDLILYLENLTSNPVNIDQVQPGVFSCINSIYTAFFAEAG
jgi:acyl carrier protein